MGIPLNPFYDLRNETAKSWPFLFQQLGEEGAEGSQQWIHIPWAWLHEKIQSLTPGQAWACAGYLLDL